MAKTKDSGVYVEVVPNNTITVFVEWGRLSDIYERLINGVPNNSFCLFKFPILFCYRLNHLYSSANKFAKFSYTNYNIFMISVTSTLFVNRPEKLVYYLPEITPEVDDNIFNG